VAAQQAASLLPLMAPFMPSILSALSLAPSPPDDRSSATYPSRSPMEGSVLPLALPSLALSWSNLDWYTGGIEERERWCEAVVEMERKQQFMVEIETPLTSLEELELFAR